jgi:Uma2 family endonuclease
LPESLDHDRALLIGPFPRPGMLPMATAAPPLKFTIGQYDLMIAAGVFSQPPAPGEPFAGPRRVELIEGEIVMMSPSGPRHEEIVDRLNEWSVGAVTRGEARVRIQQSLGIPEQQRVPRPDLAWVRPRDDATRRPEADDALLVIEVAETSLPYDLGGKAAVYAAGDVIDSWVVDVVAETVHVVRRPGPVADAEHRVVGRGESIAPRARPEAILAVESLFAPRR